MKKRAKQSDGESGEESRGDGVKTGTRWWVATAVLGLGAAAWAGLDRERQRQAEGTVRTITQGVQDASAAVQNKYVEARTSARNLGLQQQVGSRLRGDKSLDAGKIEVHVEDESTAVLKGLVLDAAAKEKAVELTRDTRGVLKVVDHLAVTPPPRVITAPTADDAAPAVAVLPRPRQ